MRPSVCPAPEWLRWLKALGHQKRGWKNCKEQACIMSEPFRGTLPGGTQTSRLVPSLSPVLPTLADSQAGSFLIFRLVLFLFPCSHLARWELRHYFIWRDKRRTLDMGPCSRHCVPLSAPLGRLCPLLSALPCPHPIKVCLSNPVPVMLN